MVPTKITNCLQCPNHCIITETNKPDWFTDDDVIIVCKEKEQEPNLESEYEVGKQSYKPISSGEAPYQLKKSNVKIPRWCPLDLSGTLHRSEKIYASASIISGRGVFCSKPIKDKEILEECHFIQVPNDREYPEILNEHFFRYKWERGLAICLGYGSIFNHSNTPNAAWSIDTEKEKFTFYATRDIEIGEEICTNYKNGRSFISNPNVDTNNNEINDSEETKKEEQ
jgi:hypothetical protein